MLISRVAEGDGGLALTPAVSLAEAKRHLAIYHAADDDLVTALVAAAQAHMEGADGTGGVLGRAVSRHTLELRLERFPLSRVMALPHPPLVSVTGITYLDVAGVLQTFAASEYHVVADSMAGFVRLKATSAGWPATDIAPDAVRVRFVVGPAECPADLKAALLLHVGHLYLNRDAVGESRQVLPMAYKSLTDPHRTHGWI